MPPRLDPSKLKKKIATIGGPKVVEQLTEQREAERAKKVIEQKPEPLATPPTPATSVPEAPKKSDKKKVAAREPAHSASETGKRADKDDGKPSRELADTQAELTRLKELHAQQAEQIQKLQTAQPASVTRVPDFSLGRYRKLRPLPEAINTRLDSTAETAQEHRMALAIKEGERQAAETFAMELTEKLAASKAALEELQEKNAGLSEERMREFEETITILKDNVRVLENAKRTAEENLESINGQRAQEQKALETALKAQKSANASLDSMLVDARTKLSERERQMSTATNDLLRTTRAMEGSQKEVVALTEALTAKSREYEKIRLENDLIKKLSGDREALQLEYTESLKREETLRRELSDAVRNLMLVRNDLSEKVRVLERLTVELRIAQEGISATRGILERFLAIISPLVSDESASETARNTAGAMLKILRTITEEIREGGEGFDCTKAILSKWENLDKESVPATASPVTKAIAPVAPTSPFSSAPIAVPKVAKIPSTRSVIAEPTRQEPVVLEEKVTVHTGHTPTGQQKTGGRLRELLKLGLRGGTSAPVRRAPTPEISVETRDRKNILDFWNQFIVTVEGSSVPTHAVYDAYAAWATRNNRVPLPMNIFDATVKQAFHVRLERLAGRIFYIGIALKDSGPPPAV